MRVRDNKTLWKPRVIMDSGRGYTQSARQRIPVWLRHEVYPLKKMGAWIAR
jgi:hypothetical protein